MTNYKKGTQIYVRKLRPSKNDKMYVVVTYDHIHEEGFGDTTQYSPHGHYFHNLYEAINYGLNCFTNSQDEFWDCWNEIVFGGFYVSTEDGTPIRHYKRCGITDTLYEKGISESERENKFNFSFMRFDN